MRFLTSSIRTKIIFPYILLTLIVGMGGAYVGTQLVFSTVVERLENQLIEAGKVANQIIGDQENRRLTVLRQIAATKGINEALLEAKIDGNYEALETIVSGIAFNNSTIDSLVILDSQAGEILKLDRTPQIVGGDLKQAVLGSAVSYANWTPVDQLQRGQRNTASVRVEADTGANDLLYTIGAIRSEGEIIGIALIGQYLNNVLREINLKSLANVTFYDENGAVRDTSFTQTGAAETLAVSSEFFERVIAKSEVVDLPRVSLLGKEYVLAFAPFELRGGPVGIYSVGLGTDFVLITGGVTRNAVTVIIFSAITVLMIIALIVTQQIIKPLARLVRISGAIAAGDLTRETGINSYDEIGHLAVSFDKMTVQLRKRTEELEELVKLQRAILSSIADGVLVQDKAGKITQMNRAAKKILGQLSTAFSEYRPDDHLPLAEKILTRLSNTSPGEQAKADDPIRETTEEIQAPASALDSDEETPRNFEIGSRSVSTRAAPVIADTQETLGSVVVLRDITLEVESERLKNKLIESLSHELLTPLVPMKLNLQFLQMTANGKLDEKQLNILDTINKHTDDLNDLITNLLDFAQIEAQGLSATDFQNFDFAEMVAEIGVSYQEKITVDEDLAPLNLTFNITTLDSPLPVRADENRLRRTLNALLDNAARYNRDGGSIELCLTQAEGYAQIDVIDTGRGIEESLISYIIKQPFIRDVSGDDTIRGNGLGLYLAGKVIEAHQGVIWFESEENRGSTFSFTIPIAENSE